MLHAVVVGIDQHHDRTIPTLSCACADARALAGKLGRFPEHELRIQLLLNEEATRRNIMEAVGEEVPRWLEPGDTVLVYFAGHGSPERRGMRDRRSRYLVPYDTDFRRVFSTAIDMERDVHAWLGQLQEAKLVVIILDACFSGAAGGRTFTGPILAESPTLPGYMDDSVPRSLRDVDLGRGRVILCAADDDQVAREDPALGHGVLTHHLLRSLERPRSGRTVDIGSLYEEVCAGVLEDTGGEQEPILSMIKAHLPRLPRLP